MRDETGALWGTLVAYMLHRIQEDGSAGLPAAVVKRGCSFVTPEPPETMTEAQFQALLKAEIEATPQYAEQLQTDLERRRMIIRDREGRMAREKAKL